jgi:histidinol-phosphate aminotransferase
MSTLLRPEIATLAEYRLNQYPSRIKLNQNENPYELPPAIKEEIVRKLAAAQWSRYPAFVPKEQIAKVARFAGWQPDGTLIGNGSNDLLQLIFTCTLERGKTAVISQPTFTLYKLLTRSLGADLCEVPMSPGFSFDVDRIIETAQESHAGLVVLCTPNNPTGSCLTRDEVVRIVESTESLVVLDEAYVQFSGESRVELLEQYNRLVILQTFSKAMGAAGLRFGYALGDPALMRQLDKVKLPYSVNIFTLLAAETLIDHWGEINWWIGKLVSERERLRQALNRMPTIRVYPSGANFLLFETLVKGAPEVFRALAGQGILIRDVSSYPMLDRGLRVSIGTPEENDEFLKALRSAV